MSAGTGAPPVSARERSETSLRRLAVQTWLQTKRLLLRWSRDTTTVVEALVIPALFLMAIDVVFGNSITRTSGQDALYGSVPMSALAGAIFGSAAAGVGLIREREDGLLARLWVLPTHRSSGMLGRLCAETVRILATTLVILGVGLALGFRFEQGFWAALGWLAVPVLFGVAFSMLITTLALYLGKLVLAEGTSLALGVLIFFSTGFVPLSQFPEAIQPVVEHQPMSYAIEAMRGLSVGGPVAAPLIGTALWVAGIALVCAGPAVIGFRRASMR